jgi:hypothetical protein
VESLNVYSLSFLGHRGVQLGSIDAGVVSPHTAESTGKSAAPRTSALDSKGLAHDGTASSKDLEVRHATCAWRDMVGSSRSSGGGERAECGG